MRKLSASLFDRLPSRGALRPHSRRARSGGDKASSHFENHPPRARYRPARHKSALAFDTGKPPRRCLSRFRSQRLTVEDGFRFALAIAPAKAKGMTAKARHKVAARCFQHSLKSNRPTHPQAKHCRNRYSQHAAKAPGRAATASRWPAESNAHRAAAGRLSHCHCSPPHPHSANDEKDALLPHEKRGAFVWIRCAG